MRQQPTESTEHKTYKQLSPNDIAFFKQTYQDQNLKFEERTAKLQRVFGIKGERLVRIWAKKMGLTQQPESAVYKLAQERKLDKSKRRFIFTWCQNNTPLHKAFFDNIKAYAKHIDADIHVILGRYKNPTSIWSHNNQREEFWDNAVLPYSDANRHDIHKYLSILSDVKIQPTAANPLAGLEAMTGLNSCVVGAPKVQLKVIPVLEGYKPKLMLTTGAVSKSNYTDSKAGKRGEFHHVYGFAVVEIKDKETYFVRQVTAEKDGSFNDLFYNVQNKTVSKITCIDVAVLGDKHVGTHCADVEAMQIKLLKALKPKYTVVHDIMDGYSVNPHEEKDPFILHQRYKNGQLDVKKEIDGVMSWLDKFKQYNLVIPSANHNDFLDRWVKRIDWKKCIANSEAYMRYAQILLGNKAPDGLLAYLVREKFGNQIKVLGRNSSFVVNGWELGQHFDVGANGARGGVEGFRKLNTKMIGGHSHTPARVDGVVYVGTSSKLRVGYNTGASSWMHADVIVHKDKKAQHIIYMGPKKEFTTFKF